MNCLTKRILGIAALVVLAACKKEEGVEIDRDDIAPDVADVICTAYSTCECDTAQIEDPATCEDALQPALRSAISQGELLELRYFGECLDTTTRYVNALGCSTGADAPNPEIAELLYDTRGCKLLAGSGRSGEPCQSVSAGVVGQLGDSCEQGLICAEVCIPVPDSEGDLCAGLPACPPEMGCLDPDGDGVLTCERPSEAGGTCNPHDGGGCATDLFCQAMGRTCTALPGVGDPCLSDICASGAFCMSDVCVALPGAGDACPLGLCDVGLVCGAMATCEALPGQGEACAAGLCDTGLLCDDNGVCNAPPALVCSLPESVGLCIYRFDGLCDEPEGTGLCEEGTDVEDCAQCPTINDGTCDEPEGTASCPEGSDPFDCMNVCPTAGDGVCDEPEGSNTCLEGTDPLDCAAGLCPTVDDGVCDEPEGSDTCPEGTDPFDCAVGE